MNEALKSYIREVPDFPKPGILFKDITPLLGDSYALKTLVDHMARRIFSLDELSPMPITQVVGLEARGFILGALLAQRLDCGFTPIRKKGKLPSKTRAQAYGLEYGNDVIEIHEDALGKDDYVVIVDDLLATGGTAEAAVKLVKQSGCTLAGAVFAIELTGLNGRQRIEALGVPVRAVLQYE